MGLQGNGARMEDQQTSTLPTGGGAGGSLLLASTSGGSHSASLPITALPSSSASWLVPQGIMEASGSSNDLCPPAMLSSYLGAPNQRFDLPGNSSVRPYSPPGNMFNDAIAKAFCKALYKSRILRGQGMILLFH